MVCIIPFALNIVFAQKLIPYRDSEKWGYCDTKKQILIPLYYDETFPMRSGFGIVKKDNKYGLVDKSGKIILPIYYKEIRNLSSQYYLCSMNSDWGIMDIRGNQKPLEDFVLLNDNINDGLLRIVRNGLFGFIDTLGNEIVTCKYSKASNFSEGVANVAIGEGVNIEQYLINTKGEVILKHNWEVSPFHEGLARKKNQNASVYGYIDKTGKTVIKPKYRVAQDFKGGYARVKVYESDSWIYIDKNGEKAYPKSEQKNNEESKSYYFNYLSDESELYEEVSEFSDGLAKVKFCGKVGYIDDQGNRYFKDPYYIVEKFMGGFIYGAASNFKDGSAMVGSIMDNPIAEVRIINKKFKNKVPTGYNESYDVKYLTLCTKTGEIRSSTNGYYKIFPKEEGGLYKMGFLNSSTLERTSYSYTSLNNTFYRENGYAPVVTGIELKDHKYGLINKKGEITVPIKYLNFGGMDEQWASFRFPESNLFGIVTLNDSLIIEPKFESLLIDEGELYYRAKDAVSKKWGYINKTGNWVIKPQFDFAGPIYEEGIAIVQKDKLYGFINQTGKLIIPFQFDKISSEYLYSNSSVGVFKYGIVCVGKNGKEGIINIKGEYIVPLGDNVFSSCGDSILFNSRNQTFINSKGNVLFQLSSPIEIEGKKWDISPGLRTFNNGFLMVKRGPNEVAIIDKNGNYVINFGEFDEIAEISDSEIGTDGYIAARKGKYWGYILITN